MAAAKKLGNAEQRERDVKRQQLGGNAFPRRVWYRDPVKPR